MEVLREEEDLRPLNLATTLDCPQQVLWKGRAQVGASGFAL